MNGTIGGSDMARGQYATQAERAPEHPYPQAGTALSLAEAKNRVDRGRSRSARITLQRVQNGWLIEAGPNSGGVEHWVAKSEAELLALVKHLAEEHEELEVHVG